MQLFLLAPLMGYLLHRYGIKFLPVLVILTLGSMGWTYGIFVYYDIVNQFLNLE